MNNNNTGTSKFLLTTAALLAGVSVAAAQGPSGAAGAGAHERSEGAMSGSAHGTAPAHEGSGRGMTQGRAADRGSESASAHQRSNAGVTEDRPAKRTDERKGRAGSTESRHSADSQIRKAHADRAQKDQTTGQGRSERHSPDAKQAQHKDQAARQGHEHDKRLSDQKKAQEAKQNSSTAQTSNDDRAKAGAEAENRHDAKERVTTGANTKTDTKGQTTEHGQSTARDQNGQSQTNTQARTQGTATQTMSGKTVNAQQQTKLQQSVLHSNKVARVNDNSINFRVDTGVVVPRRVSVVSVSTFPVLVDMYPAYRQDTFFVVDDEIVVLDSSRRIVDVIPAGSRTHYSHHGGAGDSVAVLDLSPEEIRVVQRVLIERGLLTGDADGIFGPRTREALITFQERQGLEANGKISRQTVSALGVSNRISATQDQTTTGQGQAGHASVQQNATGQNSDHANTSGQQNSTSTNDQARQNQASTTGQAGKQHSSGQAAAPATGSHEPNNQRLAEPDQNSAGGQSNHPDLGRK